MAFSDQQEQFETVEQYTEFLGRYYREEIGELVQYYPNEQQSVEIEWSDLFQYSPELAEAFQTHPSKHTELLEEALASVDLPLDIDLSDATVRVHAPANGSMTLSVGETRAKHCGEYLALHGQLSKATKVKPKLLEAVFECQRCGCRTTVPQVDTAFQTPHSCTGCDRDGPFRIVKSESEFVDHQLLRLQQPPEEVKGGHGRHIDVHVHGEDLAGALQTGDRVTMSGIYELGEFDEDVVVDTYLSGRAARVEETDYEDIDIGAHKDRITALATGEEGDPYELLIRSLAPKIHGHASIKLAIILQLFGGCRVEHATGESERGDSHLFLLGDPGTAKSHLLQAATDLAPRSAYASGKGATAAGLTAAAVSDDFGETQWSLEAGAMVQANKGIAALDELDKIDDSAVSSLHDALEAQRVTINKAGINTTLPAQTAVLAAGNPKYGRFDPYEPLADQVDIVPSLLSRFDIMFLLQDQPDVEHDQKIASHVVDYRQDGIADDAGDVSVPVDKDLFRAWIAHAKRSVRPRIKDREIRAQLVDSFVHFRQVNADDGNGPVPITVRKLEGIQRLAEASARVRLSETVEEQDINRARELVGESMRQVGMDPETGDFDADLVETGTSKAQHDRIQILTALVEELSDEGTAGAPTELVVEKAATKGIAESKAWKTIEKLRTEGKVYSPGASGEGEELVLVR